MNKKDADLLEQLRAAFSEFLSLQRTMEIIAGLEQSGYQAFVSLDLMTAEAHSKGKPLSNKRTPCRTLTPSKHDKSFLKMMRVRW